LLWAQKEINLIFFLIKDLVRFKEVRKNISQWFIFIIGILASSINHTFSILIGLPSLKWAMIKEHTLSPISESSDISVHERNYLLSMDPH
jgi:hypothetical protein